MGCFSGRLMSSARDQKLFCKLSSPFCCSFDEFVEEKVISPSYSSAIFNQSILKKISPEYSLKGLMLKLQFFGHLILRTDSFEKTLMLERLKVGKERDDRGWDGWMSSPTQCTWVWVNSESWWWTGRPGLLQSMGSQRVKRGLSDWIELNYTEQVGV